MNLPAYEVCNVLTQLPDQLVGLLVARVAPAHRKALDMPSTESHRKPGEGAESNGQRRGAVRLRNEAHNSSDATSQPLRQRRIDPRIIVADLHSIARRQVVHQLRCGRPEDVIALLVRRPTVSIAWRT